MLLLRMGYLQNYPDRYPVQYTDVLSAIDYWMTHPRVSMIEFENSPELYNASANN
jgi:hypothetical protein